MRRARPPLQRSLRRTGAAAGAGRLGCAGGATRGRAGSGIAASCRSFFQANRFLLPSWSHRLALFCPKGTCESTRVSGSFPFASAFGAKSLRVRGIKRAQRPRRYASDCGAPFASCSAARLPRYGRCRHRRDRRSARTGIRARRGIVVRRARHVWCTCPAIPHDARVRAAV